VPDLQRLRADHEPAVFAASISDRGDEFCDQFTDRHSALLAEQEAGGGAFYVLVDEDGSVLGRFNLYDINDGTADRLPGSAACRRSRRGDCHRAGVVPAGVGAGRATWAEGGNHP
jgi:hypothetical protein